MTNPIDFPHVCLMMDFVMTRTIFFLPLLLLASCATCWRGGEPLRTNEIASLRAVSADFLQAKNIKVYHGLAHPRRDAEIYAEQLRSEPHDFFAGFAFHQKPVPVSASRVKQIVDLYCNADSHQALSSPKTTCAGFHPDYALVWSDIHGQRVLQICYGCHEWKYIGPGGILHTDINEPAYFEKITRWLPPQP